MSNADLKTRARTMSEPQFRRELWRRRGEVAYIRSLLRLDYLNNVTRRKLEKDLREQAAVVEEYEDVAADFQIDLYGG